MGKTKCIFLGKDKKSVLHGLLHFFQNHNNIYIFTNIILLDKGLVGKYGHGQTFSDKPCVRIDCVGILLEILELYISDQKLIDKLMLF